MIPALGLGLVIGVLVGLLGGGGSILAVPALVYGAGVPLAAAAPTSLLVVGILGRRSAPAVTIPAGAVAHRRGLRGGRCRCRLRRGSRQPTARRQVVLMGFAAVMVAAGVQMMREQTAVGGDCALPGGGINWRGCLPEAIGSGVVVGFLTGLFGVGGGFLIIPALALLLGLPMSVAVGTSLVIIVFNSLAGPPRTPGTPPSTTGSMERSPSPLSRAP